MKCLTDASLGFRDIDIALPKNAASKYQLIPLDSLTRANLFLATNLSCWFGGSLLSPQSLGVIMSSRRSI